MLKKLPLGLKIVLALALAAGAGLLALFLFLKSALEPEKLRLLAVKNAEAALGRKVRLGGVSVGLMTGLTLEKLEISELPDFAAGTFASVEAFELRVLWKPLLQRKVVVDHIAIKGLNLNVTRNAKGGFNFDDLTAGDKKEAPASATAASKDAGAPMPFELDVKTASLSAGTLHYQDKASGDRWHVSEIESGAEDVGLLKPFNARMTMRFAQKSGPQGVSGRLAYDGELDLSQGKNIKTRVKKLTAEALGFVVGAAGTIELAGADITADLDPLTVKGAGLAATSSVRLSVAGDKINATLRRFSAELSDLKASFTATLKADAKKLSIPDLKGSLGDGELSASLNVSDYAAAPKVELKASLSRLDAAKVLAGLQGLSPAKDEAPAGKSPPQPSAGKKAPAAPPAKAAGHLRIGELVYSKTTAKDLSLNWDLSGITPDLKSLTGWAKMRAAGGTYINEPGKRSGLVKALLLPLNLLKNIASVGGALTVMPDFNNILFTEISGDYAFQNGLMTISDFHLYSQAANILAKGAIDLPAETLKLQVTASIAKLAPIVADVGGTFDDPKIKLRLDKLLTKPIEKIAEPALNILKGLFKKN